jgi:hypothetical protein
MEEQKTAGNSSPERKKSGFLQEVKEKVRRERAKNRLFNFGKRMAGWTPAKEEDERRFNKGWDIPPSFRCDYTMDDATKDEFLIALNSFSSEWPVVEDGDLKLSAIKLTANCELRLLSRYVSITINMEFAGYDRISRGVEIQGSGVKINGSDNRTSDYISVEAFSPRRPSTDFLERFPELIKSGKWIRQP